MSDKINWADPKSKVTEHFSVKDCIWLPTWGRIANENDGLTPDIKANLLKLCAKMEEVRTFLGDKPIKVHCMFRPEEYNKLIGGSTRSAHLEGLAIDFHWDDAKDNKGCDETRALLLPKLIEWDLRMENTSFWKKRAWVHLDMKKPNPNRYFIP